MKKAVTISEAVKMANATMMKVEASMQEKYGEVRLWDVCYKAFKTGLTQEEVNEIIDSLRNKFVVEMFDNATV